MAIYQSLYTWAWCVQESYKHLMYSIRVLFESKLCYSVCVSVCISYPVWVVWAQWPALHPDCRGGHRGPGSPPLLRERERVGDQYTFTAEYSLLTFWTANGARSISPVKMTPNYTTYFNYNIHIKLCYFYLYYKAWVWMLSTVNYIGCITQEQK